MLAKSIYNKKVSKTTASGELKHHKHNLCKTINTFGYLNFANNISVTILSWLEPQCVWLPSRLFIGVHICSVKDILFWLNGFFCTLCAYNVCRLDNVGIVHWQNIITETLQDANSLFYTMWYAISV